MVSDVDNDGQYDNTWRISRVRARAYSASCRRGADLRTRNDRGTAAPRLFHGSGNALPDSAQPGERRVPALETGSGERKAAQILRRDRQGTARAGSIEKADSRAE